jgi:hypothetical protein
MMRCLPVLALALAAVGCVDFVEPQAQPAQPGGLSLTLQFTDSTNFAAHVTGMMVIGTDEHGRRYTVEDPTLRIDDIVIHPVETTPTSLGYRTSLSGEAAIALYEVLSTTPVMGPRLAGVTAPELTVVLPQRLAEPSSAWTANSLVLRTGLNDTVPPTVHTVWLLTVRAVQRSVLQASQQTATPPTFILSRGLIGPCDSLDVRFDSLRDRIELAHAPGYAVAAVAYVTLYWSVPCS